MITNQEMQVGFTLEGLSRFLNLSVDFLEDLGLRDFRYSLSGILEVPYLDVDGCLAEDGLITNPGFFNFPGGKRPSPSPSGPRIPYGMWRMDKISRCGWVLLVKHEVDCWILWNQGIPAVGIPDHIDWSGEWSAHLEGLEVLVWDEDTLADPFSAAMALGTLKLMRGSEALGELLTAHLKGQNLFTLINALKAQATSLMACLERNVNGSTQGVGRVG
jgi:hypothetical protein